MRARDVVVRKYFYPAIHQLKPYKKFVSGKLRVSEDISSRILCLPIHADLTAEQVDFVAESVLEHLEDRGEALAA
jgi:dTDP-4-amino-4,6-dideoxygalactose transaminase